MSVNIEEIAKRRVAASEEFNLHEHRADGLDVTASLSLGLTFLRESLYSRVHDDVRRSIGLDSMLAPVSEERTERVAKLEIEIYQIAVSVVTAAGREYLRTQDDWYLQWLGQYRIGTALNDGKVSQRIASYLSKTPDGRRLKFGNVMAAALPELRKAPLVLFRLMPMAVRIVTALAFGDEDAAAASREQQAQLLPSIGDCHECRGRVLPNGQPCPTCGNPLWKFEWLAAED